MAKVFVHQTEYRLWVETTKDHVADLEMVIKYTKPSGKPGVADGEVEATWSPTKGMLYYDVMSEEFFDEEGTWTFWAWVRFKSKRIAPGKIDKLRVWNEGE